MANNRLAAIGLLLAALGLVVWLVGGFINHPAVSSAVGGTGLTVAVIGVVVAIVGFAVRMLRR